MNNDKSVTRSARLPAAIAVLAMTVVLLPGLITPAQAAVIVSSDFSTDAEGWTGLSCPNPGICALAAAPLAIEYQATGGNPGGYIRTRDPSNGSAGRVVPPSKFSTLYAHGQTLSFDALIERNGGDGVFDATIAPLVTIEAPFGFLVFVTTDFPVNDGVWKHYDVPFAADPSWLIVAGGLPRSLNAGEFEAVFDNMTRVTIISEWLKDSGAVDTGGLDNVQLTAVPIPETLPLFATALLGLGLKRKRRS